jgi:hypothetical protein
MPYPNTPDDVAASLSTSGDEWKKPPAWQRADVAVATVVRDWVMKSTTSGAAIIRIRRIDSQLRCDDRIRALIYDNNDVEDTLAALRDLFNIEVAR